MRPFKASWGDEVSTAEDLERLTLPQLCGVYEEMTGRSRTFARRRTALARCAAALEGWRNRVTDAGKERAPLFYLPAEGVPLRSVRPGSRLDETFRLLRRRLTLRQLAREMDTTERGALRRIQEVRAKLGYGLSEDPETGVIRTVPS